eukprot:3616853-Lingulodinium_polyedra.AAC.1
MIRHLEHEVLEAEAVFDRLPAGEHCWPSMAVCGVPIWHGLPACPGCRGTSRSSRRKRGALRRPIPPPTRRGSSTSSFPPPVCPG